ncbi:hypothetical protein EZJ43_03075 [Pedobacter changchengzhani]|uniref:Transposase IS200-like domain-containing protein n=1 Tax=Pedobacter changchengzhani TaxID=2529274 RepID=A0A4R5MMT2_9SPHI|nr:transposase [Pedobacter changchengzhani]TDG37117.1 hypothetical protein EZJ43_03075 [Pedobacter changchengzhani]
MIKKFDRRSIRLKGYDYSKEGLYFITICCQDRICRFGSIIDGEMELNKAGEFVELCWFAIPEHFPNVELHEFTVMPNHLHGIIEIVGANHHLPENNFNGFQNQTEENSNIEERDVTNIEAKDMQNIEAKDVSQKGAKDVSQKGAKDVSQKGAKDVSQKGAKDVSPVRGTSKTIGSIVRGFKIGVTKLVSKNLGIKNLWQRNYYENIIRDEKAYQNISQYIQNNALNWGKDKFHS